jgi:hypothetical protein
MALLMNIWTIHFFFTVVQDILDLRIHNTFYSNSKPRDSNIHHEVQGHARTRPGPKGG